MDPNSIFRIIVGILLVLGGIGWAGLVVLASAMADSDPDPGSTNRAALVGLGVAILGGIILALPLL